MFGTRRNGKFGEHLKFESAINQQDGTNRQHIEIPTLNMIDLII